MNYNFDEIIDRRHGDYSYSMKWGQSKMVSDMVCMKEIPDTSIALYTADMDFRCAKPVIKAMHEVADHGIFGYSRAEEAPGYYEAITGWFQRRHSWTIRNEEILYVNGTVEAIRQIIGALTMPGEGVILQRPVYGPFTGAIEYTKRKLVNNALLEKDKGYYEMDFEDLEEKAASPNNKLLLLCNPHNPVGRIWTDEELRKVAEICRRNNVIIFADEIHGDLIRRNAVFHPINTVVDPVNIITATAVNKTFNLAGLHATNLVIRNEELREKIESALPFIAPTPFTIAATIAAYNEGEEWLEQLIDYLDSNIDFLIEMIHKNPGEITVITTGPLTNLALALTRDSSIAGLIKEAYVLGGCFQIYGNITPVVEYNIFADPEAAKKVLNSDMPISLIPLDVCENNKFADGMLTRDHLSDLEHVGDGPVTRYVCHKFPIYIDLWREYFQLAGFPMDDVITAAAAVDETLFTYGKPVFVDVELEGELTRGQTIAFYGKQINKYPMKEHKNTKIATKVDGKRFMDMFTETLSGH